MVSACCMTGQWGFFRLSSVSAFLSQFFFLSFSSSSGSSVPFLYFSGRQSKMIKDDISLKKKKKKQKKQKKKKKHKPPPPKQLNPEQLKIFCTFSQGLMVCIEIEGCNH